MCVTWCRSKVKVTWKMISSRYHHDLERLPSVRDLEADDPDQDRLRLLRSVLIEFGISFAAAD